MFLRKLIRFLVFLVLVVSIVYLIGPRPEFPAVSPDLPHLELGLNDLQDHVNRQMAAISDLKPGNQSQLVFADSVPRKTPFSMVFLHGFSASPMAGVPVVPDLAREFGCNLYIPLLAGHGRDTDDAFLEITPAELVASAAEAIAIGNLLGDKTIVIGSSTGCTLGAYLAANNPASVDAMLFFAPNFDLADWKSDLLAYPWGEQLAHALQGDYYHYDKLKGTPGANFWNTTYRIEGLIALENLLRQTMTDQTFERISQPSFYGYYFKNDSLKDQTIDIPTVKARFEMIKTPSDMKELYAFPNAGGHVMLSNYQGQNLVETFDKSKAWLGKILPQLK